MRAVHLVPVLALGLAVQSAAAQSTSGKPVDADAFLQGQGQQAAPQANPMMQTVIKQSLQGTPTPEQLQEARQQLQGGPAQTGPQPMWTLGISEKTCKDLYNPVAHGLGLEAESWSQGLWTGLNMLNPRNHNVGKQTDPKTIVADITESCAGNPSKTLMQTVSEVYAQYMAAGK